MVNVTIADINLLMLHLVQNEEVVYQASEKLSPDIFNLENELHYKWLWGSALYYYQKYDMLIPKTVLQSWFANNYQHFDQQQINILEQLIDRAYARAQTAVGYVIDLINQLIEQRVTRPRIQETLAIGEDENLLTKLTDLTQNAAAATIAPAKAVPICDADYNIFRTVERVKTGVPAFDYLCGGSRSFSDRSADGVRPGDTILLLGVTGQGKTTLAGMIGVEAAKHNWRVGFFGYEYPIDPGVSQLIFGYAAGLKREYFVNPKKFEQLPIAEQKRLLDRYKEAQEMLKDTLFTFDMVSQRRTGLGINGMQDVEDITREYDLDLVIVDQASSVMTADKSVKREDARVYLEDMLRRTEAMAGSVRKNGKKCTHLILHQADTETKGFIPTNVPRLGIGESCKSMENYTDTTLALMLRDKNNIGWFGSTKTRNNITHNLITKLHEDFYIEADMTGTKYRVEGKHFIDNEQPYQGYEVTAAPAQPKAVNYNNEAENLREM